MIVKRNSENKIKGKIKKISNSNAFIKLKENFPYKKPCRLINTCKSSLGIISKKILDNILPVKRSKTGLLQSKNYFEVLGCFNNIKNKNLYTFIQFDMWIFILVFLKNS